MDFRPGLVFAWFMETQHAVKTSTPMKPSMQMLCRLLDRVLTRGLFWALALASLSLASQAAPGAATGAVPASAVAGKSSASAAATTPLQALQLAVRTWVADSQSINPEQVSLAPLDARLQVQPCSSPLAMDLPFASPQTVRVRCTQPAWQLFVRVSTPLPVVAAGAAAAKAANSAAAVASPPEPPAMRQVLVAAVPLQRGMSVSAGQVRLQEVEAQGLSPNVLLQLADVQFAEMARNVRPGTPLNRQDLRPRVLVKRGQMVLLSVGQSAGFQISARVEALQDGRFGEQIQLKNRESGRQLSGQVMGPNRVQGL
jgi:flagella basal body P-ring formation protein FlgA